MTSSSTFTDFTFSHFEVAIGKLLRVVIAGWLFCIHIKGGSYRSVVGEV